MQTQESVGRVDATNDGQALLRVKFRFISAKTTVWTKNAEDGVSHPNGATFSYVRSDNDGSAKYFEGVIYSYDRYENAEGVSVQFEKAR